MSSQVDMFSSQEPPATPKSRVKYGYIVLCNRNESIKYPFNLYSRSRFSMTEIQDRWLESILDNSSRLKNLQTLNVHGKSLCLFGKIGEEVPNEECQAMVNSLNAEYSQMRAAGSPVNAALYAMVKKYPYRLKSTTPGLLTSDSTTVGHPIVNSTSSGAIMSSTWSSSAAGPPIISSTGGPASSSAGSSTLASNAATTASGPPASENNVKIH